MKRIKFTDVGFRDAMSSVLRRFWKYIARKIWEASPESNDDEYAYLKEDRLFADKFFGSELLANNLQNAFKDEVLPDFFTDDMSEDEMNTILPQEDEAKLVEIVKDSLKLFLNSYVNNSYVNEQNEEAMKTIRGGSQIAGEDDDDDFSDEDETSKEINAEIQERFDRIEEIEELLDDPNLSDEETGELVQEQKRLKEEINDLKDDLENQPLSAEPGTTDLSSSGNRDVDEYEENLDPQERHQGETRSARSDEELEASGTQMLEELNEDLETTRAYQNSAMAFLDYSLSDSLATAIEKGITSDSDILKENSAMSLQGMKEDGMKEAEDSFRESALGFDELGGTAQDVSEERLWDIAHNYIRNLNLQSWDPFNYKDKTELGKRCENATNFTEAFNILGEAVHAFDEAVNAPAPTDFSYISQLLGIVAPVDGSGAPSFAPAPKDSFLSTDGEIMKMASNISSMFSRCLDDYTSALSIAIDTGIVKKGENPLAAVSEVYSRAKNNVERKLSQGEKSSMAANYVVKDFNYGEMLNKGYLKVNSGALEKIAESIFDLMPRQLITSHYQKIYGPHDGSLPDPVTDDERDTAVRYFIDNLNRNENNITFDAIKQVLVKAVSVLYTGEDTVPAVPENNIHYLGRAGKWFGMTNGREGERISNWMRRNIEKLSGLSDSQNLAILMKRVYNAVNPSAQLAYNAQILKTLAYSRSLDKNAQKFYEDEIKNGFTGELVESSKIGMIPFSAYVDAEKDTKRKGWAYRADHGRLRPFMKALEALCEEISNSSSILPNYCLGFKRKLVSAIKDKSLNRIADAKSTFERYGIQIADSLTKSFSHDEEYRQFASKLQSLHGLSDLVSELESEHLIHDPDSKAKKRAEKVDKVLEEIKADIDSNTIFNLGMMTVDPHLGSTLEALGMATLDNEGNLAIPNSDSENGDTVVKIRSYEIPVANWVSTSYGNTKINTVYVFFVNNAQDITKRGKTAPEMKIGKALPSDVFYQREPRGEGDFDDGNYPTTVEDLKALPLNEKFAAMLANPFEYGTSYEEIGNSLRKTGQNENGASEKYESIDNDKLRKAVVADSVDNIISSTRAKIQLDVDTQSFDDMAKHLIDETIENKIADISQGLNMITAQFNADSTIEKAMEKQKKRVERLAKNHLYYEMEYYPLYEAFKDMVNHWMSYFAQRIRDDKTGKGVTLKERKNFNIMRELSEYTLEDFVTQCLKEKTGKEWVIKRFRELGVDIPKNDSIFLVDSTYIPVDNKTLTLVEDHMLPSKEGKVRFMHYVTLMRHPMESVNHVGATILANRDVEEQFLREHKAELDSYRYYKREDAARDIFAAADADEKYDSKSEESFRKILERKMDEVRYLMNSDSTQQTDFAEWKNNLKMDENGEPYFPEEYLEKKTETKVGENVREEIHVWEGKLIKALEGAMFWGHIVHDAANVRFMKFSPSFANVSVTKSDDGNVSVQITDATRLRRYKSLPFTKEGYGNFVKLMESEAKGVSQPSFMSSLNIDIDSEALQSVNAKMMDVSKSISSEYAKRISETEENAKYKKYQENRKVILDKLNSAIKKASKLRAELTELKQSDGKDNLERKNLEKEKSSELIELVNGVGNLSNQLTSLDNKEITFTYADGETIEASYKEIIPSIRNSMIEKLGNQLLEKVYPSYDKLISDIQEKNGGDDVAKAAQALAAVRDCFRTVLIKLVNYLKTGSFTSL